MQLIERDFYVGAPTQEVISTRDNVLAILSSRDISVYPKFRCQAGSNKYTWMMNSRAHQVIDVKRQLGPKQASILVNPLPYTAVDEIRNGSVLQTCLWSVLPRELRNEEITNIVEDFFGSTVSAWIMENIKANKSIPEIKHMHVFVDVATLYTMI